jgi:2'-5' RNA ligase
LRCFLALPLSAETAKELYEKREMLRAGYRGLKWTKQENYHITLFFFGEINRGQIGEIMDTADSLLSGSLAFPVELTGPGQFPPVGPPRVIYETVGQGTENCRTLYKKLHLPLGNIAELEKRKYHPHVTLARVNPNFRNFPPPGTDTPLLPVKGFMTKAVFYESIPGQEGSHYNPLAVWTFKKGREPHESR